MNGVKTLLARCRELGAELTPTDRGTLKIRGPRPLPDTLRDELKRNKAEVLALLTSQRRPSAVRPVREPEAVLWLRQKLTTGPQRIGDLMVEASSLAQALREQPATGGSPLPEPRPFHHGGETTREAVTWPCPHCGRQASIDDVDWSLDGERRLTFWRCDPCGVVAVTPDAIKEPPTGWVRRTIQ